jgi:FAD/FMN-containing dehydrogenase
MLMATAALAFGPALPSPVLAAKGAAFRRVRPGEVGWPGEAAWEELRRALGGELIRPQALVAACATAPNSSACEETLAQLRNPFFIGDQPSGTQVSGWFNAWAPGTSAYVVAAKSSADVAAAVNFARTHKLRVAVKGGGHSYQGTSNAADSLLIWTRAMHAIELHDAFVPSGCKDAAVPAVTVEAGAMWIDAYDAVTTKAGRYVQGGGCATVGVAGLIQSGGFGSFSKYFGMAAASLLEAEVVTADGVVRTANACTNADLFFAIKGGGGGSFGVVTKVTLRTHELPEFFGAAGGAIKAASDAAFKRLIDRFMEFYADALFNPHWGESVTITPSNELEISMVCAGLGAEETAAVFQPFFDWVKGSPSDYAFAEAARSGAVAARTWWDAEARRKRGSKAMIADDRPDAPAKHAWWSGDQEQVGAFIHGYESAWLPQSLLKPERRPALTAALFEASRQNEVELHFNKGLAGAPAEAIAAARSVATNPAVLDAFTLAIIAEGGASRYPGLPGVKADDASGAKDARAVDAAMRALAKVAPNAGSYVSESNYFNPRWAQAFWGANYARLRGVKAKVDPDGLFFVHHGVGSENWSADGFVRRG